MKMPNFKYMRTTKKWFYVKLCLFVLVAIIAVWELMAWLRRGRLELLPTDHGASSSITNEVPAPSSGRCTIFRCANQTMDNVQNFFHPSFLYVFLDESGEVRKANAWPSWCRVPHLVSLKENGHSCVVYADDDVFLNLSRLHHVIDAVPYDFIIVGTNNRHGRFYNINAGMIVFSNIQGPFSSKVIKDWRKSMDNPRYHNMKIEKLREQSALNNIINCNMTNVLCYHLFEKADLGIISHCFSCLNNNNPTGKKDCMRHSKTLVKQWDRGGDSRFLK